MLSSWKKQGRNQTTQKEINEGAYEGIKETFNAISSLGDIINSFEDFGEMNTWEQFQLLTSSIFSSIDTIKGLIDTWQSLNEILELFGLKRQALQTIETSNAAANIAAVTRSSSS